MPEELTTLKTYVRKEEVMEYIIRTKTGFKITVHKKDAILELVRSDQGDGGWSLHSLNGDDDDYLLTGSAEETIEGGWDRPSPQDIRSALALELVETLATSTVEDAKYLAHQAKILIADPKSGRVPYL